MFNGLKLFAVASVAALFAAVPAFAETRIQGAGATFPKPLYLKWVAEYNKVSPDVKVDYQGIGSGGGIKGITDGTVDFGASDAPMTDDQLKKAPGKLLHIPTVAGPAVLIYNLPEVSARLKLDGPTIAKIYLGQITTWNDPAIAKLNPGTTIPSTDVLVVHRSDGSGTSWIFTNFLTNASEEWASKVKYGTAVKWPLGLAGKGNDGVAAYVKQTPGGIGYVELAFAQKNKIPYALLINKAGKEVDATIDSVVAAASTIANSIPEDFRITNMTNADGEGSYPICGFTYLLVYQELSDNKLITDAATAGELVKFLNWAETDGQGLAKDLNYAKLPDALQAKVIAEIKSITYKGTPVAK